MATSPITIAKGSLPRSLDVNIQISRPQTEIATDMSLMCFLSSDVDFLADNSRVQYFSTMTALESVVEVGSATWFAGNAFFSQTPRPETMAVGRVFTSPQPAGLVGGSVNLAALKSISDGAFAWGASEVTELDFTSVSTLDDVVSVLSLRPPSGYVVSLRDGAIVWRSSAAGAGVTIPYATAPANGTDVSALLGLTESTAGNRYVGYTPGSLVDEAKLVAAVSRANGRAIYGWALDSVWRDGDDALAFAAWAESQEPAILGLTTNSAAATNAASITDIGYRIADKGYRRTFVFYHNNPQPFPEISYLARILAVDYGLPDSTITMKFKELPGIETVPVTETDLIVLNDKRINTYTAIGNNSRTVREGVQGAATWFTDTLTNLDNFKEELQVEVYNVFLRRKKVPYTNAGQNLLVSAAAKICAMYTQNGTFAPRDVESDESESGYITLPATEITPTPIYQATASDRAARLAPPIQIVAYEAGAMHKININVDVFS